MPSHELPKTHVVEGEVVTLKMDHTPCDVNWKMEVGEMVQVAETYNREVMKLNMLCQKTDELYAQGDMERAERMMKILHIQATQMVTLYLSIVFSHLRLRSLGL